MSIITKHQTLGGRMQAARLFAGLDQGTMAASIGRDRTNISKYENGHTEVPAFVLIRWAEMTGASLNWLAWGEESRPRESNSRPSHYKCAYCGAANHASFECPWKRDNAAAEFAMLYAYLLVRRAVLA